MDLGRGGKTSGRRIGSGDYERDCGVRREPGVGVRRLRCQAGSGTSRVRHEARSGSERETPHHPTSV